MARPQDFFIVKRSITAREADSLVGRERIVRVAQAVLHNPAASVVLHGERGIGKTSVAKQLLGAFQNGTPPHLGWGLPEKLPVRKCVWLECRRTSTLKTILIELLAGLHLDITDVNKPTLRSSFRSEFEELTDLAQIAEIGTRYFELDNPDSVDISRVFRDFALVSDRLRNCGVATNNLLIFIDEVDRCKDLSGVGEFVKEAQVQFCLIGIGDTWNRLLEDHPSVRRKFASGFLRIDPLPSFELMNLLAQIKTRSEGFLSWDDSFADRIIESSYGSPSLVQELASKSAEVAYEESPIQKKYHLGEAHWRVAIDRFLEEAGGRRPWQNRPKKTTVRFILSAISESPLGLTRQELIDRAPTNIKSHINGAVDGLRHPTVDVLWKYDERYRFADASQRLVFRIEEFATSS